MFFVGKINAMKYVLNFAGFLISIVDNLKILF